MPVSTRALIEQIKTHEGHAEVAGKIDPKNKVGNSKYGTYKGVGRVEYSKEGVTPEMAKEAGLEDLYGKEIVTGYGHALLGQELRDYFTDPKKKEYWDNLSQEDAEELLNKDVKKHQKYTDELLEQHKINPKDLSREQYNSLVELTFQLGKPRFEEFTNFWDYASEGNWEEAAKELKYGKTREEFSDFWNHSKGMRSRIKTYMKNLSPSQEQSTIIQSPSEEVPANQAGGFRFSDYYSDVVDTLLPKAYADTSSGAQSYFESMPTPEYDTPEEENEARLSSYFSKEELNTAEKNKQRLSSYFSPKELQAYQSPPDVIEDVASPSQPLKSSEDLLKEMSSPSQFLYSPETSTSPAPSSPAPTMSQGEAATRGLVHGGTLGLAKKAAGGANWLAEGMGRMYGEGGLEGAIKRSAEEKPPIKTPGDALALRSPAKVIDFGEAFRAEDYQSGQKAYQKKLDEAKDDWAKTVFASELLGGSFLPGSIALKGASTAKRLLGATAAGGIEGGIYAGAESEAQDLPTLARDMGLGLAYGAGGGAALGGLLTGGAGLYKKIKGVEPEKVAMAKLVDRDVTDLVLSRAEKRAKNEADFNLETLRTIQSFAGKKEKKQNQVLNLLNEDLGSENLKKILPEWEKIIDKKALRSRTKDFLEKIPNAIKKVARKEGLDPKTVFAYNNWRREILDYMKWVNDIKGRVGKVSSDEAKVGTKKDIGNQIEEFKKNIKSGLVNKNSYNQYKIQKYLVEEYREAMEEKVGNAFKSTTNDTALRAAEDKSYKTQNKGKLDPFTGVSGDWLVRRAGTVTNAAELIDNKANTKVQDVIGDLYIAGNKKAGFTSAVSDELEPVLKLREKRKYANMTNEDIVRMIESGNNDPLANGYRKVFTKIREEANKKGVAIDEYKFGQDKYVPMKRKGAADLIIAIENKGKELNNLSETNKENITKLLKNEEVNMPEETLKDVNYLTQFLEQSGVSEKISSFNELIQATEALRSQAINQKNTMESFTNPILRSVHERYGDLPMWARETNLGKMANMDAGAIGDIIYKRPVLDRLDSQITLLKLKGFDNSADYLTNLKLDILGIPREGSKLASMMSIKNSIRTQLWFRESFPGKLVGGLVNSLSNAVYGSALGFNPDVIVRDLTQPYLMAARELGVGPIGDGLALRSTTKVIKDYKKISKKFSDLGLVNVRDTKASDFEGLKNGLAEFFPNNKYARKFDKYLDLYVDTALKGMTATERLNRLTIAQMSEDVAQMLIAGNTKWLKNAPDEIKSKIQNQLDAEEGVDLSELTKTIGKWLLPKTQLSYAKDDMYELGRELGSHFSMLTKWPTAIASDIATKFKKGGWKEGGQRVVQKYFGSSLLAAILASRLLGDDQSARSKAIFGSSPIRDLPVTSALGIVGAVTPLPASTILDLGTSFFSLGAEAASGRWDARDYNRFLKESKKAATYFLPVGGSIIRTKKTLEDLSGKTDRDKAKKKRKKRKRYFD